MNRKIIVTLALFSLLASMLFTFQPTYAASRTITVPNDYSTINAALQNAGDGDTIFVKKGTYDEHLIIDKAISLKGEDMDSTVINGNSSGTVVLIQHDNVEVSGFTIKYDETPNAPKSIWMWSTRLAGIHLLNVKNCNIHANQVLDCGGGIWLYDSSHNSITDNYVARNDYGVRVESSNNTNLEHNTVTGNWAGISLISSGNSKLRNNALSGNTENFAISGEDVNFINDVDSSNLVDGKPIYYWIGVSSRTVPSDAGCVVLVNCLGVTVEELNLAKNSDGIILVNCMNSFVANNTITLTNGGITSHNSICDIISGNNINCINAINVNGNGTTITNNNIVATNTGVGTEGCYQTVTDNTVTITQWQGNMIKCSGSYNKIMQNWLNGTSYTYSRIDGPNNLFYENTMLNSYQLNVNSSGGIIAKNDVPGITVTDGSGTTICGNRITQGLGPRHRRSQ